jgi:hypothetical protein
MGLETGLALTALSALGGQQAGQANKQAAEAAAAQQLRANEMNEAIEAEKVKGMLSDLKAATFASGATLAGSPAAAALDIQRQYRRDASIRRYGAEVGAEQLRQQGRIAALEGTASALGGLSGGLMTFAKNRIPKAKEEKK